MVSSPLRQYISQLESIGELSRICVTVDPLLEIAAITNRVCKREDGGAALLFEHPAGSSFPVATNLFGSTQRTCRALGVGYLNELSVRLTALLDQIPALDFRSLDRQIAALPEFSRFAARTGLEPDPALIEMTPPNLERFPFLQTWPDDGSADGYQRYMTLPQVFTSDPDGGTRNCGVYRVQVRGAREAAVQWKAGSGASRHAELYHRAGKAMPVAIVLGGDPAILFSAMFPLPGDLDEMSFAGFLRGTPLATSPCRTIPLHVPEGAEIVIEGYIEPGNNVSEGPFGNHSGFYTPAAPAALMRITAISHRHDAVIPATVVGPPPMEDCWMAKAWESLLLSFLQKLIPAIKDIRFPMEWVFHQSAIISLENPQPGMVRNISRQLWALPWFSAARILLFVTADAEPLLPARAAWRSINLADFSDDIFHDRTTGRLSVDATGCNLPRPEVKTSADETSLVTRRWKEYGIA